MPQQANIVVLKANGTTSITWTGVVPSAGDKSPAIYRSLAVGNAASHKPEMQVSFSPNGPTTARRARVKITYPSLATASTGRVEVVDKAIFEGSWLLPQGMPSSDIDEFIYQAMRLVGDSQVVASLQTGYAPT